MYLSLETLFVLGIVGFYIYDSTYLYFYNEFNIQKGFKTSFHPQLLSKKLNFFSKYLVFFNLLLPYQLIFKCSWKSIYSDKQIIFNDDITHITTISRTLKPLQFLNILLFLFIIFFLPLVILLKLNYVILAITITTIYFLNIINIFYVLYKRKKLKLSWVKVLQLAMDVFLCPPFSVNLLRKISLNYVVKTEGTILAKEILSEKSYQEFINTVLTDLEALKSASSIENISKIELREQQLIASQNLNYKSDK